MEVQQETQQEAPPRISQQYAAPAEPQRDPRWQRKSNYPEDPRYKSPALATVLSVVPGLGQVYIGYYRQGFINIIVVGTIISVLAGSQNGLWPLTPLLGFFLAFFWLFNLVDAARRAAFYNQALSGITTTDAPREFSLPERHGSLSLVGGLLLIVAGAVILSHTLYGYSLEWLSHWWPLGLVLVGAYLVYEYVHEAVKGKKPA